MQRWCGKFRFWALSSSQNLPFISASRRLIHSAPQFHEPLSSPSSRTALKPFLRYAPSSALPPLVDLGFRSSCTHFLLSQRREFSSKERKRKPGTPVTSKLKKIKMKSYSSFKCRFRTMNDGTIRRWRAGKRHNAHLKSKKSKRRLRLPALVHPAYAKVMKKLNFCG
ncbi:uncharacterized protein LOC122069626 [Macadamia integrifolia]|uniref:uncharacterized protein LOC122069626 n=1 Tax=Macadamia integrifolia TaxID=60698 RepID=UPI001C4F8064|nr:uncharacterized protein LOC122069626 [Macadamia integrifolia]